MISGKDFGLWYQVCEKLDKGQPLSVEEQRLIDAHPPLPRKYCGCGCGDELDSEIDLPLERYGEKLINSDCYWRILSDFFEEHPIVHVTRRSG